MTAVGAPLLAADHLIVGMSVDVSPPNALTTKEI